MLNLGNEALVTRVVDAQVGDFGDVIASEIVDTLGYESVVFIVLMGTIAATGTATVTVSQGDVAALTDAAALAGASVEYTAADGDLLAIIDIGKPAKRYLRVDIARAVANVAIDGVLAVQYRARALPVTQGATVLGTVVLVSPAEV